MEVNKIYNEDCLDTMKRMPDNFVDLTVTDPPYRVISGGKGPMNREGQAIGKNDGKIFEHNDIKISQWLPEVKRIMKEGSHGYIFTNQLNLLEFLKELEKNDLQVHRILIWDKGIATWTRWYMKCYEPIIFFRKGKAKAINNQSTKDILDIPNPRNKFHPTEKPVALLQILIHNSIEDGTDLVYDPFMGSGSTAIACRDLSVNYIGSEISSEYCEIIKKRLAQQTLI